MKNSVSTSIEDLSLLYHQDYYLWLEKTTNLLRQGDLSCIDSINLAEEVEDMGRSEKRAIYSNLKILFVHLLKYKYQPQKISNSWKVTIREHRQRLRKAFQESPSLEKYFQDIFTESYRDAREIAADETGLNLTTFPIDSPFIPEETLSFEYLPNSDN